MAILAPPDSEVVGVASQDTPAGQVVPYVIAGPLTLSAAAWDLITGDSGGLVPGTTYFLSPTTAGRLTNDASIGRLAVGDALSATTLLLRICCQDVDAFIFDPSGSRGAIQNNGSGNQAIGTGAVAEGAGSNAENAFSHAEGFQTDAGVDFSHAEGFQTVTGNRGFPGLPGILPPVYGAHAEGVRTRANNIAAHAEGKDTNASGNSAHAEGSNTIASADSAHAEGAFSNASSGAAHAEGQNTIASAPSAHAEGNFTTASGPAAHAEGSSTQASGGVSHAEGFGTQAIGNTSHAQGYQSQALRETQDALASGSFSTVGDAQTSRLILRGSTPGLVANESVELKYGAFGNEVFELENGKTYAVKVVAACGGVQGLNTVTLALELSFNVWRGGGLSIIEGSPITASYGNAGGATWTLAASIGAAPDRVVLTFSTGAGTPTVVNVAAKVEFTEVVLPTVIP